MKSEEHLENNLPEYIGDIPIGQIVRSVKSIRYGYVQIIIQDSKVVQIEKTEKTRLVR